MLTRIHTSIFVILAVFGIHQTFAQTTYTSVSDGSWGNSANWSPAGVPNTSNDIIIINHSINRFGGLTLNGNVDLRVGNTGVLNVVGNSLTTGNWGNPRLTVFANGVVNVDDNFNITGADNVFINGTLNATNFSTSGGSGGTLSITGDLNLSGTFTHNVSRTITLNNGNITTGGDFTLGSSPAVLNTTGATIDVGGDLTVTGSAVFNHASDSMFVAGDFENSGSVGVDFYGWVEIAGGANNVGSSNMTFNGPTTIGSLTGSGATQIRVNSELLVEGDINISGSADIVGSAGGILGWDGTFTTDNSGSRMSCADGTEYDTDAGSPEIEPPFNPVDLSDCSAGTFVILPIELAYFNGENINGSIVLSWATLVEENNNYFTILKSDDGINFYPIGTVPGAGNSNNTISYEFLDNNTSNNSTGYYYQLMQTDYDGTSTTSEVIYVSLVQTSGSLAWVKNPATDNEFIITFSVANKLDVDFTVYNALGIPMEIGNIKSIGDRKYTLSFNQTLSSGLYILTINNSLKEEYHRVIVE